MTKPFNVILIYTYKKNLKRQNYTIEINDVKEKLLLKINLVDYKFE